MSQSWYPDYLLLAFSEQNRYMMGVNRLFAIRLRSSEDLEDITTVIGVNSQCLDFSMADRHTRGGESQDLNTN
jgi:hypothetical protein